MNRMDINILVEELICLRNRYKDTMTRSESDVIAAACNFIDKMNKFHDFSNNPNDYPKESERVLVKLDTGYFDVATYFSNGTWLLSSSDRTVGNNNILSWRDLRI